ncbi:hypothetical protein [Hafnia alvei]|uniref:hypothetical protein n=1 Tax=Hafnia alvei TaxID=569 RepID=UPI00214BC8E9|nr:hypothetical protein [Hafnia alvei]
MQIEIGEYVITSDTYNLILNEKKVAKEGKSAGEERLQSIGFYSKNLHSYLCINSARGSAL